MKRYSAAAATHAPVEAMLRLRAKRPLALSEVEAIECHLKPFPLLRLSPQSGDEGRFSMAYCLAVAFVCGRLAPDDFSDQRARDYNVRSMIAKVRHHEDVKSLTVILKNGEKLSEPILPAKELTSWDEVVEKFSYCTGGNLAQAQRSELLDIVAHLEALASVRTLTEALRPSAH